MKTLPLLVLAAVLAIPAIAADTTKAAPAIPAAEAKLTAPFVLKDGAISQPERTEVSGGGRAVFIFSVPATGSYVIHGVVNAPDDDSNSFYLNIDGELEDPLMIWDLETTSGFEERVSNWRGNGEAGNDEFTPKAFKLIAGEHKLIIGGREPAALKSVSIQPAN